MGIEGGGRKGCFFNMVLRAKDLLRPRKLTVYFISPLNKLTDYNTKSIIVRTILVDRVTHSTSSIIPYVVIIHLSGTLGYLVYTSSYAHAYVAA